MALPLDMAAAGCGSDDARGPIAGGNEHSPENNVEVEEALSDNTNTQIGGNNSENLNPSSNAGDSFQPDIFDPRYWDSLDSKQVNILAQKGPKRDLSIQKGPKDRFSRRFSSLFYNRILSNGESCDRDWLVYSKELDRVFCFSCKLFTKEHRKGQLANESYNDWAHLGKRLKKHETDILEALLQVSDTDNDPAKSSEAKGLANNELGQYEFIVAVVIWYEVLYAINLVSKQMQAKDMFIDVAMDKVQELISFFEGYRETGFLEALESAKGIALEMDIDDQGLKSSCDTLEDVLKKDGKSDIDAKELYMELKFVPEFIPKERMGPIEILQFPIEILQFLKEHGCFPNATIAYRVLLTIPVTVASAERNFSKLKLLKTYLRSTMTQ
uniref:HAT C-terminal dimerisation domain-containing protein n=1 Tax=Saccharum spontaneum TaxID=62335 RepID=A0A678TL07_SACSP|nr:hypothetical protein SS27B03_000004 [Saccharum spontaneum]